MAVGDRLVSVVPTAAGNVRVAAAPQLRLRGRTPPHSHQHSDTRRQVTVKVVYTRCGGAATALCVVGCCLALLLLPGPLLLSLRCLLCVIPQGHSRGAPTLRKQCHVAADAVLTPNPRFPGQKLQKWPRTVRKTRRCTAWLRGATYAHESHQGVNTRSLPHPARAIR